MARLEDLEKRIEKIESRNKKVEIEKAWETSITRKVLLIITTYALMSLFMNVISVERPFLNAIIPTMGYVLSTLGLPFVKKIWEKGKAQG
jgi:hypothetical protein